MNLAFGLAVAPEGSTFCQSDQVLSGVLVFPVLVEISTLPALDFQESLPKEEMESVSLTVDSYVPEVASASPIRNNFPIFAEVAYRRLPACSNRVVCSSVDSMTRVMLRGPSTE